MSFCKFSSEFVISNQTQVDNLFINEFLPHAPAECVKVYLYGLYKCGNASSHDNTIENFARVLNLSEQEVEDAFLFWQEEGLVQVLNTCPIEVRFLPLKNVLTNTRKYNTSEFDSFNKQVQEILSARQITPTEYDEYYYLIKTNHIQPEALLMIIKYCTSLKGENVGYKYILTVAKNWANEGVTTAKAVEEKLCEFDQLGSEIEELLKICGAKRLASVEEKEILLKWTKDLDFSFETIIYVAKDLKKKLGKLNFEKLDQKLMAYYEMKALSIKEIEQFEKEKSFMYKLAKDVAKKLGLYYENLEPVVENYIQKWLNLGHNEESILTLADYSFKNSIRTLEGLDNIIAKLYKLGIVSVEAIGEYIGELVTLDKEIKNILDQVGIIRLVTNQDRTFYRTWTENWNISKELLDYAIEISKDKFQPLQYMNKILSSWHSKNITSVEDAKKFPVETQEKVNMNKGRSYKSEEVNILFNNLSEIEL